MPFILFTEKEAKDCHSAFRMLKSMLNITPAAAGSDISDVAYDAEALIRHDGLGPQLLTVDLDKNTLTGKKHPAVVRVRERMIDSHSGGQHSVEKIRRTVYDTIRKLKLKTGNGTKIEHRSKEEMKEELSDYIGWDKVRDMESVFTHPGVGQFAGAFGPFGSKWRTAIVDNHSGTTENTYFLGGLIDAKISNQKMLHIMRDTKHKGDSNKIVENIQKKFNFYRTYNKKVKEAIYGDADMLLPEMIAVPNYFTKDCEIEVRDEVIEIRSNSAAFIFIGRNELEQWVDAGDALVPLDWIFRLA